MSGFVPDDFLVPLRLVHPPFVVRPLTIADVVKDYDAVMSSVGVLKHVFGPADTWPSEDLTFEQDLIDLGWHHKEFQRRTSFTYTVMDEPGVVCLGCIYLYPTRAPGCDAEAYCWIRASRTAELDAPLFGALKSWLGAAWPFRRVAFPGRDMPWTEWLAHADPRAMP